MGQRPLQSTSYLNMYMYIAHTFPTIYPSQTVKKSKLTADVRLLFAVCRSQEKVQFSKVRSCWETCKPLLEKLRKNPKFFPKNKIGVFFFLKFFSFVFSSSRQVMQTLIKCQKKRFSSCKKKWGYTWVRFFFDFSLVFIFCCYFWIKITLQIENCCQWSRVRDRSKNNFFCGSGKKFLIRFSIKKVNQSMNEETDAGDHRFFVPSTTRTTDSTAATSFRLV